MQVMDSEMCEVEVYFKLDLSSMRVHINGARHLELKLEVSTLELFSETDVKLFHVYSETQEKLDNFTILVEFPEDISAKFESNAKHQNREIHDSLYNSMHLLD